MKSMLFLGIVGISLVAILGCSGAAESESSAPDFDHLPPGYTWGYVTHGKQSVREVIPLPQTDTRPEVSGPLTHQVEADPNNPQPGDYWIRKQVGKHTEKVLVRDVPIDTEKTTNEDGSCKCFYGYFPSGKHMERRSFCIMDGKRVFCGSSGEGCGTCGKAD